MDGVDLQMDELTLDEIVDSIDIEETVQDLIEVDTAPQSQDIIVLNDAAKDLVYSVKKLRNNIDNTERLLNKLTLDMLTAYDDDVDSMTIRYTSLASSMNRDIELLQKSKKDLSQVMLNLQRAAGENGTKNVTNNLTINDIPVSTVDIIKKLKGL